MTVLCTLVQVELNQALLLEIAEDHEESEVVREIIQRACS